MNLNQITDFPYEFHTAHKYATGLLETSVLDSDTLPAFCNFVFGNVSTKKGAIKREVRSPGAVFAMLIVNSLLNAGIASERIVGKVKSKRGVTAPILVKGAEVVTLLYCQTSLRERWMQVDRNSAAILHDYADSATHLLNTYGGNSVQQFALTYMERPLMTNEQAVVKARSIMSNMVLYDSGHAFSVLDTDRYDGMLERMA